MPLRDDRWPCQCGALIFVRVHSTRREGFVDDQTYAAIQRIADRDNPLASDVVRDAINRYARQLGKIVLRADDYPHSARRRPADLRLSTAFGR